MCGIAGWLSWGRTPETAVVAAMTEALHHRGPDGGAVQALGPVVLGHRRLAIIDPRPESDQPFSDPERRHWLTFNGEIYNFRELRRALEEKGVRFHTQGDTEVVLEAYKAWGESFVERLVGQFALAIWDEGQACLLLARDRAGEKPLFYQWLEDGGLVFASEPGAVRRHPAVDRGIDPNALAEYLALNYSLGERTLSPGVKRLPPAHVMLVARDRPPQLTRYWDPAGAFREKRRFASQAAAAEELNALLDQAVAGQMISDVPLGAFLSGGIDSSAVVAAMTRHRPPAAVQTFSMGFAEKSYSELPEAERAASHLGVTHRDRVVSPEPAQVVQALARAADEPLADSSAVPMYYLAAHARETVTVVLSGDGGDECFAGYETYLADRLHALLRHLPRAVTAGLTGAVERLWPVSHGKVSFDYKLRRFLHGQALTPREAHLSWRSIFDPAERLALMQPDWRAAVEAEDPPAEALHHFEAVADCHPLDQALYVDFMTWLPGDILVKVDRMTMAHSLEARAPFLDHRLVEFAAALPPSWKLKGLRMKHLLKQSQRDRLPAWLLARRKKGFNAPISGWLQGPLGEIARDALASQELATWFRPEAIARLWEEHASRRRDNGLRLLSLLSVALWLEGRRAT